MSDFEGKKIKITFGENEGWASDIGLYIKEENGFIVYRNQNSKKIRYANLRYVKFIEIMGEANEQK